MTDVRPAPPDCVYRLATLSEWRAARETGLVPLREIDARDGYVHLSTAAQLVETANLHFADAADLLALEIPLEAVAADVKFELAPKRGEAFPHLYARLRRDHVRRVLTMNRAPNGFAVGDALAGESP